MTQTDLPAFIHQFLQGFLADPENNNLGPGCLEEIAWQNFVIGYSSGDDDLYEFWKTHIGPFHWTPAEVFALGADPKAQERGAAAYADTDDGKAPLPGELTVVSWALSHTDATKADNRKQEKLPSERWARTRVYGQRHNRSLHTALVAALAAQGYSAVSPARLPGHRDYESEGQGRSSAWSERHAAYTSGLGTFGLCGGLITSLGQAVRFGSVVVRAQVPPTKRTYTEPFEYCLHFNGDRCTACLDRCPVGAVMSDGSRDKNKCVQHLEPTTAEFVQREFGFKGYGCGLCQTGVPCESSIPRAAKASTRP